MANQGKKDELVVRARALNMDGGRLSVKYGFSPSTFHKSVSRPRNGQHVARFLVAADDYGPLVRSGGTMSLVDLEPDGTLGVLRRWVGAAALERRAQIWPAEVSRENLARWLVRWQIAIDEAMAKDLVGSLSDAFMAELVAAEKVESVEGVRLLCARRFGASVVW
jgi:hypothetical protein